MKKALLSLSAAAILLTGGFFAVAQNNQQVGGQTNYSGGGGLATQPYQYTPGTNNIPVAFLFTTTPPTPSNSCYNPVVAYVDGNGVGYVCVPLPGTTPGAAKFWKVAFGNAGLGGLFTTLASASTIAPTTQNITLTGTATITNITVPTGLQPGASITFYPSGASALGTGGNITAAETFTAGIAYPVRYDGVNFHPEI